jgi:hypothetical protein
MNEMILGGVIGILSALPGLGLGVALLMGKWRPASLAAARDPDRARLATGQYLIVVNMMIVLLGIGLITLPEARVEPMVPYAVGTVLGASGLGLVPLLRATRP